MQYFHIYNRKKFERKNGKVVTLSITPEEALSTIGAKGSHNYIYNTQAGYTFAKPNENRAYVKVLKYILDKGSCSKVEILEECLHKRAYCIDFRTGKKVRLYGEMSSLFSALRNAYLIDYTKDFKVIPGVNAREFLERERLI